MKKVMLGGKQVTFRTKISNSKQELARIISENGGWRDGEFAAQDSDGGVGGYEVKPEWNSRSKYWWRAACGEWFMANKIKNHHQTVLSRTEYFHLYPAPDADGWIEWSGGECPVDKDARIDIRMTGGKTYYDTDTHWGWNADSFKITHYRLHKPEQAKPEFCESVMRSIPDVETKPTIEQLAADYRNAKDYAESKQQEADDAKADANEALRKLEIAGEAIGLIVTPITAKQEPELVIHDWRDLQVGDIIECIGSWEREDTDGHRFAVTAIDPRKAQVGRPIRIEVPEVSCPGTWGLDFKFIRRP